MSDSDVELVPFAVAKQAESERKRRSILSKSEATLKR